MTTVTQLGLAVPGNPLGVAPAADFFGDPQHGTPRWNETTFFEAWSPETEVGVFLHMGRHPGDLDLWWCQAITYLPGGRLTSDVNWGRTREPGARTGNVSLAVVEPLSHWSLTYDGAGELTDNARQVRGLSGAGPKVGVQWALDAHAAGPVWDLARTSSGELPDFAKSSHSQQTFRVSGTVVVDGEEHRLDGIGVNDHSRGPRDLSSFAGDQWVVAVMPGYTFHTISVWNADDKTILDIGVLFDADGHRSITARRHGEHDITGSPRAFDLVVDDGGRERRFALEVLHGCTISATQGLDNLNGVGWDLPGDTAILGESPIRITAENGDVGYGHLERCLRLDRAIRPADGGSPS